MAEKVNEKVKKAKTELDIMSMNEKEREIYEEIELARWFYKVDMNKAKNEGRIEGKAEGMELGAKKEKIEIVKAMLKNKLPIEIIKEITKLSKEEIEKIKKETKEV